VDFTSNAIVIQLNFSDPIIMSMSQKGDMLYVKFIQNGYFFELPTIHFVKKDQLIFYKLPPQVSPLDYYYKTSEESA